MATRNTSHLAGEFLVAGELARRGYPVSITFGNAKSVDIYADTEQGTIKIDAKAGRWKGNWPLIESSVNEKVYYIFVHLQSQKQIRENRPPEYFIVRGKEIISEKLIDTWKVRQGIRYLTLNTPSYKERWDKLPKPIANS